LNPAGRKELIMPNVSITLIGGRPPEKKEELIKKVTDAIVDTLGVSKESVHIALYEVPKENIGEGGISLAKKIPK
jgi:4-oxalocrotonate tautomerase